MCVCVCDVRCVLLWHCGVCSWVVCVCLCCACCVHGAMPSQKPRRHVVGANGVDPPGLDPWMLQPRSRPPARESTCGGHRGGQCSPHWRRANCSALIRSHTLHQRSQTAYMLGILKSSDRCRQLLSLEQLLCRRPTETRAVWWLAAVCGFNSCSHTHTIDHA